MKDAEAELCSQATQGALSQSPEAVVTPEECCTPEETRPEERQPPNGAPGAQQSTEIEGVQEGGVSSEALLSEAAKKQAMLREWAALSVEQQLQHAMVANLLSQQQLRNPSSLTPQAKQTPLPAATVAVAPATCDLPLRSQSVDLNSSTDVEACNKHEYTLNVAVPTHMH